jgi:hypothetical protein
MTTVAELRVVCDVVLLNRVLCSVEWVEMFKCGKFCQLFTCIPSIRSVHEVGQSHFHQSARFVFKHVERVLVKFDIGLFVIKTSG